MENGNYSNMLQGRQPCFSKSCLAVADNTGTHKDDIGKCIIKLKRTWKNDWVPLFRDEGLGILHLFMEKEMEKQVDTMASWDC